MKILSKSPRLIKDKVYGEVSLQDPAILGLLKSEPLLRLQKIAQFGVPDKYYHISGYSRFEHSVGVMLLLQKLGASREEQVAGLLHDVSHTAFSHTIDWVLGPHEDETFQDERHSQFIDNPKIARILKSNNLDPQRIFNLENFRLLDREIPGLCADRIDYALREFPKKVAQVCVKHLRVVDGKIVFDDKRSALLFANNFLLLQTGHWGGFEAVIRWHIFANVLKRAMDLKIIHFSDFYEDDDTVMEKLESCRDEKIRRSLELLTRRTLSDLPEGKEKGHKKFRYVDPEFIKGAELFRLSEVDKHFARDIEKARGINKKGISIPSIAQEINTL